MRDSASWTAAAAFLFVAGGRWVSTVPLLCRAGAGRRAAEWLSEAGLGWAGLEWAGLEWAGGALCWRAGVLAGGCALGAAGGAGDAGAGAAGSAGAAGFAGTVGDTGVGAGVGVGAGAGAGHEVVLLHRPGQTLREYGLEHFLASPSSSFMTGSEVYVDGGASQV